MTIIIEILEVSRNSSVSETQNKQNGITNSVLFTPFKN